MLFAVVAFFFWAGIALGVLCAIAEKNKNN